MKRTDIMKKERELKRAQKKEERIASLSDKKDDTSIGAYIDRLNALFFHDETRIYNTLHSEEILELLEEMKSRFPADELETIIRKAISKTKVVEKEKAFEDLISLVKG
jgi:hypothetical protein